MTGTIDAYSLTGGQPPYPVCAPGAEPCFTLAADQPAVKVSFAGNQATNLMVVKEGGEMTVPRSPRLR